MRFAIETPALGAFEKHWHEFDHGTCEHRTDQRGDKRPGAMHNAR